MEIIEGNSLSKLCDYSFGDHHFLTEPGYLPDSTYKEASANNAEFLNLAARFRDRVMTLFIDNIRLYVRPIETAGGDDEKWVTWLLSRNDLLSLCHSLPDNKFVIFTSHEDTPIDERISIPVNVLGIHAVNALYWNEKIHPFPYGLQRRMGHVERRIEIMKENIGKEVKPSKLLYINCGIGRNEERQPLAKYETNDWLTARFDKDSRFFPYERYQDFLDELRDHKFVICPKGHGMDCHRNWETLYLRRVPVMIDHPYMRKLMGDFPVLWVKDWNVTKEMLLESEHLYEKAQSMELGQLDLKEVFNSIMSHYK